jgi:hypothetical protein
MQQVHPSTFRQDGITRHEIELVAQRAGVPLHRVALRLLGIRMKGRAADERLLREFAGLGIEVEQ